jgi:hypothetical protein
MPERELFKKAAQRTLIVKANQIRILAEIFLKTTQ